MNGSLFPSRIDLDEYETVNLREGLLFLRSIGGDTGDWLGQILIKLPATERAPNVSAQEQRRNLAHRVGLERPGVHAVSGVLFSRLIWWWQTRHCDCHWQEPYGCVVMAGCPDHD